MSGADLWTDGKGAVHFNEPANEPADHSFRWASNLLQLNLESWPARHDSVEVWGEGAAGTKGAEHSDTLMTDLGSVSSRASVGPTGTPQPGRLGDLPIMLRSGALRSGESVAKVAAGRVTQLSSRPVRGTARVFGTPGVEPGQWVTFDDLPTDHSAAALLPRTGLRVRRVVHHLNRNAGFTTELGF